MGQAKAVRPFNQHDRTIRHINADLDHRGGDQQIGFTGATKPMPELENKVPEDLQNVALEELERVGIEVVKMDHHEDNPDYLMAAQNTRDAVDALLESLADDSNPEDAMATAAHVDLELTGLSEFVESDAIALIDYAGFKRSAGNNAKMMLISTALLIATQNMIIYPASGSAAKVTLIDTRDGALLWSNSGSGQLDESSVKAAISRLVYEYEKDGVAAAEADASESTTPAEGSTSEAATSSEVEEAASEPAGDATAEDAAVSATGSSAPATVL